MRRPVGHPMECGVLLHRGPREALGGRPLDTLHSAQQMGYATVYFSAVYTMWRPLPCRERTERAIAYSI